MNKKNKFKKEIRKIVMEELNFQELKQKTYEHIKADLEQIETYVEGITQKSGDVMDKYETEFAMIP